MASAFWISTVRPQRRQLTLNRCWAISDSRSAALDRSVDRASARSSSRSACQYSGGRSSSGAKVGAGAAFLPAAEAIFSISFLLGMRQLAGRSVMARLEHNKNKRVEWLARKICALDARGLSEPALPVRLESEPPRKRSTAYM